MSARSRSASVAAPSMRAVSSRSIRQCWPLAAQAGIEFDSETVQASGDRRDRDDRPPAPLGGEGDAQPPPGHRRVPGRRQGPADERAEMAGHVAGRDWVAEMVSPPLAAVLVGDGCDPVAGFRQPGLGADLLLPGGDRAGETAGSAGVPGRELTQPRHFRIGFCQFQEQRIAGGERLHFRITQGGVPDIIDVTAGRPPAKDLADEPGFPFQGLPHE